MIVGEDVTQTVLDVLNGGIFPSPLNHMHVVLIPKKQNPNYSSDFWPINLYNVIYKLITKVMANRLKGWLPSIINANQSAFMSGCLITDNILIAFEIFHDMNIRSRVNGGMALKLDMS